MGIVLCIVSLDNRIPVDLGSLRRLVVPYTRVFPRRCVGRPYIFTSSPPLFRIFVFRRDTWLFLCPRRLLLQLLLFIFRTYPRTARPRLRPPGPWRRTRRRLRRSAVGIIGRQFLLAPEVDVGCRTHPRGNVGPESSTSQPLTVWLYIQGPGILPRDFPPGPEMVRTNRTPPSSSSCAAVVASIFASSGCVFAVLGRFFFSSFSDPRPSPSPSVRFDHAE